ncbi:hypothetical protein [Bradyrhizobium sp. NP1]|uniref:hypothetical protein n=1 Tax=Bradyrhizobium sp. NP1 TaxID=3049772 RepID=UPI0025A599F3|nr:hypothetical protein [Bradyrhizobium sp. NP1]WJR75574.1 hypothetical protein QOU61_22550 [Bradyrhizobium sp. NP1]
MSVLHPVREPCPVCGRPMKLVRDETAGREHYVCFRCDGDPLHDDTVRRWAASPLKPPAET